MFPYGSISAGKTQTGKLVRTRFLRIFHAVHGHLDVILPGVCNRIFYDDENLLFSTL